MSEQKEGVWLLRGNSVYRLMHHGWNKGHQLLRNEYTVSVQADTYAGMSSHAMANQIWALLANAEENAKIAARERQVNELAEINNELLEALKTLTDRISYYASLADGAAPNIEQWAYTDASGDVAKARAAIAKAEQQ